MDTNGKRWEVWLREVKSTILTRAGRSGIRIVVSHHRQTYPLLQWAPRESVSIALFLSVYVLTTPRILLAIDGISALAGFFEEVRAHVLILLVPNCSFARGSGSVE